MRAREDRAARFSARGVLAEVTQRGKERTQSQNGCLCNPPPSHNETLITSTRSPLTSLNPAITTSQFARTYSRPSGIR